MDTGEIHENNREKHNDPHTPIKKSSHLNDILNRDTIQSEENSLKCDVPTEVYDTDRLNDALLSQLKKKDRIDLNDIVTDSSQIQNDSTHDSDIFSLSSGLRPPYAHLNLIKEIFGDGEDLIFNQRLQNFDYTSAYPSYKCALSIDPEFKVPECIWTNLLGYQRAGLRWLRNLNKQKVGGILSDEMGLGKTVQIVSFLGSLHFNCKNIGTKFGMTLIIVPVTLIKLWLNEIYCWWPYFRVVILHHSCTNQTAEDLLKKHLKDDGIIVISTYNTVLKNKEYMIPFNWDYIILDEGHKIKNPTSNINLLAIRFRTPHRIIVSGTPIQNNLKELWSLVNFVYPGLLGQMDLFLKNVAFHITKGSYNNASVLQIKTGFTCAKMLKSMIEPYLLRRTKKQVQSETKLPPKSDFVLFCHLTPEQADLYVSTVNTMYSSDIKKKDYSKIFNAIIVLRKICNHPYLIDKNREFKWKSSSKLVVLHSLLHDWKSEDHKVLIYSQSVKMLNILEEFCIFYEYNHKRMDGSTPISQRQELVDKFNTDPNIFIFLLTTKVGGIGISLTGADRVIIYDPDWNPTNDVQAKERVWRIGQTKNVTIYRLITSGTIEEKIYNRQVFKQFLANKVLENPSHARVKLDFGDIHSLFAYSRPSQSNPDISVSIDKYASIPTELPSRKRKYKWRKQTDIPSDDEVTPTMIDYKKYVKKIREIEDSTTAITDIKLIEAEAEKIAASAIDSLKSQSIVKQIESRNKPGLTVLNSLSSFSKLNDSQNEDCDDINGSKIALSLKQFLISQGGSTTTQKIISRFKKDVSKGVGTAVFKKLLKTMADFKADKSDSHIKGYWHLKRNFY